MKLIVDDIGKMNSLKPINPEFFREKPCSLVLKIRNGFTGI